MRRSLACAGVLALLSVLTTASPSFAQQSVNFYLGGFVPRSADARDPDDVLLNNLDVFNFDLGAFKGVTFGGEWLVGVSRFAEVGLGVGYYSQTVASAYWDYENTDGSDIQQDLSLRMVPFTATVRWLPLGRQGGLVPYVGAGVGIIQFRYRESGDFVDFSDCARDGSCSLFNDTFTGSGAATGPLILGGARVPVGPVQIGGEIRYQHAKGELPASEDFAGSRIDLGGFSYLVTVNVRF